MNVELLNEVKARILAEPDAFRMDVWSCGTAHCIAGWACHLSGRPVKATGHGIGEQLQDGGDTRDVAVQLLGIPQSEADLLFCTSEWPCDLERAYDNADDNDDRRAKAQIAAQRIERYIESEGKE